MSKTLRKVNLSDEDLREILLKMWEDQDDVGELKQSQEFVARFIPSDTLSQEEAAAVLRRAVNGRLARLTEEIKSYVL